MKHIRIPRQLEEGNHTVVVKSITKTKTKAGDPEIMCRLEDVRGDYHNLYINLKSNHDSSFVPKFLHLFWEMCRPDQIGEEIVLSALSGAFLDISLVDQRSKQTGTWSYSVRRMSPATSKFVIKSTQPVPVEKKVESHSLETKKEVSVEEDDDFWNDEIDSINADTNSKLEDLIGE